MTEWKFKVTERPAFGWVDPRSLVGSCSTYPERNPYEALSKVMAKVCTPYWPCTDLPKEPRP